MVLWVRNNIELFTHLELWTEIHDKYIVKEYTYFSEVNIYSNKYS